MNINKKWIRNDRGITLIEVLAVIVILSIISSMAVLVIGDAIQKARRQAFVSNAYIMRNASTVYYKNKEFNHEPVEDIVTYRELVESGFLDVIIDPDTGVKWEMDHSNAFVVFNEGKVASICLVGTKRKLCGDKQGDRFLPMPVEQISEENVKEVDS